LATPGKPGSLIGSLVLCPASGTPVKYRAEGGAYRTDKTARKASVILMRLMRVAESRAAFIAFNEKIQQLNGEISRRQRTEAALRKERETLQVTLSSIGDAVIVTDANGCITCINPVAEAVLGLPATQINGRALVDIFRIANEQTLEPIEDPIRLALGNGLTVGAARHAVLVRADGPCPAARTLRGRPGSSFRNPLHQRPSTRGAIRPWSVSIRPTVGQDRLQCLEVRGLHEMGIEARSIGRLLIFLAPISG
jgi:PAS domain S-box-containing protein